MPKGWRYVFRLSSFRNLAMLSTRFEQGWGLGAVPLHGRVGQPAEIGEAYVLLAGPGGNYITGTVIHVNGGVHIGGA